MTRTPEVQLIPRAGATESLPPADWAEVTAILRKGEVGPYWLSVGRADGTPHVRPVFAAWATASFFFVSKDAAAKTRHLAHRPEATVSVDLGPLHLMVEGRVARVTGDDRMRLASAPRAAGVGWAPPLTGDQRGAGRGAPTGGGPPYQVYELVPVRAYAFPTQDQVEPTRWVFA